MNKLQNDFTTKQQSEKLLVLGMPRLSANFYYDDENEVMLFMNKQILFQVLKPDWKPKRLQSLKH